MSKILLLYPITTWIAAIIVIFLVFLFAVRFCTLFLRNRGLQKREYLATNEITSMQTLVNTNIGLSNHLSLQQDSNLFAKVKSLAKGGQGEIFMVQVMNEKMIKEIGTKNAVQKVFFISGKSKEILLHEVSIMAMLKKYPYFGSIIAYTLDPLSIVMKYYPEGSLDGWISRKKLSKTLKLRFSFEIASVLTTMHVHELAHCDSKSKKVLIEILRGEPHCCLSDFAITQVFSESIVAVKEFLVFNLKCLSCFYTSPESFDGFRTKKLGISEVVMFTL